MAFPKDMRIWISELEGLITSASSSVRNEVIDELERNRYVFEATQITREEDELGCFKPLFLTIGPLHFDLCNPAYETGNALKMEALRFIIKHDKQAAADSNAPPWERQDGLDWKGVFSGIVDTIARKEDEIRRCYREGDRRIPSFLVGRDFGWMILVDACFILVSLYIIQSKTVKELIKNNDEEWPCLHFLTRGAEDATLRLILRDMVLLENQLPSWVLKEVADMLHIPDFPSGDYRQGCKELVSLMLGIHYIGYSDLAGDHLLSMVRISIIELVLNEFGILRISPFPQSQPKPRIVYWFLHLLKHGLYWLIENIEGKKMAVILSLVIGFILIILLLPVIMIIAVVMVIFLIPSFIIAYFWPNPILTSEGHVCPQEVLPYFQDEEIRNLVLRNVIALERCSPSMRKTVSNYVFLMGEILGTQHDVEALQAIGLVPKTVNSEREVQRWKSLVASAKVHGPPYADFDDPISLWRRVLLSPEEHSKLRMMWWTWELWVVDLKKTYGSSPWIALSTFAAIALLFMTAAQVVCLFISCNKP